MAQRRALNRVHQHAHKLSHTPYGAVVLDDSLSTHQFYSFKCDVAGNPLCCHDTVVSFLANQLREQGLRCVFLFTECTRKQGSVRTRYRASPLYKRNPWYDWCWLDYEMLGPATCKQALNNQWILRSANLRMMPGNSRAEQSDVHSCPARLLAFCRFISPPPGCPPIPETTDRDIMKRWAHLYYRSYSMDQSGPIQVVVHTTLARYKAQHRIGTEFFLQTAKNKALNINKETKRVIGYVDQNLVPYLVPLYRLESVADLRDHVYVFEYEGALSHYYNTQPPVIVVKDMHNGISSNFLLHYCS